MFLAMDCRSCTSQSDDPAPLVILSSTHSARPFTACEKACDEWVHGPDRCQRNQVQALRRPLWHLGWSRGWQQHIHVWHNVPSCPDDELVARYALEEQTIDAFALAAAVYLCCVNPGNPVLAQEWPGFYASRELVWRPESGRPVTPTPSTNVHNRCFYIELRAAQD